MPLWDICCCKQYKINYLHPPEQVGTQTRRGNWWHWYRVDHIGGGSEVRTLNSWNKWITVNHSVQIKVHIKKNSPLLPFPSHLTPSPSLPCCKKYIWFSCLYTQPGYLPGLTHIVFSGVGLKDVLTQLGMLWSSLGLAHLSCAACIHLDLCQRSHTLLFGLGPQAEGSLEPLLNMGGSKDQTHSLMLASRVFKPLNHRLGFWVLHS